MTGTYTSTAITYGCTATIMLRPRRFEGLHVVFA